MLLHIEQVVQTTMNGHKRNKMMSSQINPEADPSQPMIYQIRLEGQLGPQWTAWFEGLTLTLADNGATLLTGPVVDQAALHGLLRKVRDLGLPLLAVTRVEPGQANAADHQVTTIIRKITRSILMQAIVYHNYGSPDVLKLEEVQKPVPQDDEVLVKVMAASTAAGDWHLLRAKPFLVRFMVRAAEAKIQDPRRRRGGAG